jgi:hypothetical protein
MIYKAALGARFNDHDAEVLGQRFDALAERGPLTTQAIVEDARAQDAILHPYFEWNDQVAAEEYRRKQAGYYVRHIMIIRQEGEEPIRGFHDVVIKRDEDDPGERGFMPLGVICQQQDLVEQIVEQARRELIFWQRRYRQYEALAGVHKAIEEALDLLTQGVLEVDVLKTP